MFEKFVNQFYTEVKKDTNLFDVNKRYRYQVTNYGYCIILDLIEKFNRYVPLLYIKSHHGDGFLLASFYSVFRYTLPHNNCYCVSCKKNCFRALRTFQYLSYHSVSKLRILSYVRLHFRLHNNLSKMQFKEKPFDLK